MADIELIGVPFDGYGRPGHQARAAAALRDAGLREAFAGHRTVDAGDLALPGPETGRGRDTSLINEVALLAMADAIRARVATAVPAGRVPVVYGADCSVLLGVVPGLRDAVGAPGLLVVDGHEDTMPLDASEDGEAANAEVGLLLGITGRLLRGPLAERLPALRGEALALLGPRDAAWRRRFNVGSLRDGGVLVRTGEEVAADPAATARTAAEHVAGHARGWWLHLDLDVLDPDAFAAQGIPGVADEPGGLSWAQLAELLAAAVAVEGCRGLSVVIYDPDQDADGADARRVVELVAGVAAHLA